MLSWQHRQEWAHDRNTFADRADDLWWVLNDPYESFMASGIHGQRLFISPKLDLVIVHFASQVMSPSVPPAPLVQAFIRIGTHLDAGI
ncbi:hypothetical protein [Streptomyces sp. NPDC088246]|uniref:hypothetical protein n=1 Tax=Streptomyces sp. NPDC088246 TaxID=3365842 RepID=UPI0037FC1C91